MLFTHHVIKLATQIRNTDIDHFTVKSLVEEPGKSIYHFFINRILYCDIY